MRLARSARIIYAAAILGGVIGFLFGIQHPTGVYWLFPYPNVAVQTPTDLPPDIAKAVIWALVGAVVAAGTTWLLLRRFGKTGTS